MTVALQNPRGCPHEYERVGIKHGLLQRRGTDAEAIAQYHDECSTENQEQGQPGAGLAEQQVQPIDHAGKAQQGWGSIGHWYVLLIVNCCESRILCRCEFLQQWLTTLVAWARRE